MGCLTAGFAKNRHMAFDKADSILDLQDVDREMTLSRAIKSDRLISKNDGFKKIGGFSTNYGALKNWQGGVLRRILKHVEKNGPIKLVK